MRISSTTAYQDKDHGEQGRRQHFWRQAAATSRSNSACIQRYHEGMKRQAKTVQYTLRGVPSDVDHVLRQKAAQRKQSLNQVILDELILVTVGRQHRADFSDLVGKWTPDPAFDEILAAQRTIGMDKWK
jgi:hypothetical protein